MAYTTRYPGTQPENVQVSPGFRLADGFSSIDFFEQRNTPFIVAVNCFDGAKRHAVPQIRTALDLDPEMPIVLCDVRQRDSAKSVLATLVEHSLRTDTR